MPKGRVPRREAKKPKKKDDRKVIAPLGVFAEAEVEVVRKRRKEKQEVE